ncbi:MAG: hypothetical protein JWO68_1618 [Actinomycetia bacterium]|nr:hypothetical protein [Actinomycetes bacterium]
MSTRRKGHRTFRVMTWNHEPIRGSQWKRTSPGRRRQVRRPTSTSSQWSVSWMERTLHSDRPRAPGATNIRSMPLTW